MRYVTFQNKAGHDRAGWIEGDNIVDMNGASNEKLPNSLLSFVENFETNSTIINDIKAQDKYVYPLEEVTLSAPIPNPPSVRDFYAFEEHVKTARGRRGLTVVPEWYEIPVFYFTNHKAIKGPEEKIEKPKHCSKLDFELELACVIGKKGRDIAADQAEQHIFGYTIMNDWSARDIQAKEMKVGLGPAKGKDFATSLGPYIVTPDELEQYKVGDRYELQMTAKVNGQQISNGNFSSIYYSFAEMIERASQNTTLYPGEIIGSGTVGTGCILELGTEIHRWLEPGDIVELEITGLGKLKNIIVE
ncbi:fumarylacetoacetate hydrolase family protein [Chengkuizengella axinellae]|uniref:Fumarylacetoacetate hydrolase family protein n=1 Tax=Chengkuizengella axinellae TaxID=3064388 RepID=A0ABT9J563_9BACL|nr:fumarylacetoacetate hydrolase family protein [Chengkuizengella sp. 2205SS18-9]MDP5276751.1 fumarylacetoacetate hydrolase family protein [Chengkuizengella sp. 2205SS18-9]